ncbi:MAG: DEAD/DEAH box helicase [Chloroflexota bacterium]|nr:DEAD/DEAH box helicase [Chloroflexota bacterium]
MTFTTFNLDPRIAAGVQALGYTVPTPIQVQAIPPIMQGRDLMGLAQTGTGKTAAFVLPILQRLIDGPRGRVRALILAPTRELAEQIDESIKTLGKQTGLHSITVYGGVSTHNQVVQLRKGVDIVVACPGRLLDHITQSTIILSALEVLVLDEADHMFDMGFLVDIRKILRHLPSNRQTLLFSATMPPDINRLAQDILRNPVTVEIGYTEPIGTVSHALYPVPQHLKTELLMKLLDHTDTESVLVFARTKHRAKRVGEQLEKEGYSVTSLQGNLSQNRREAALDGFRDGKFQIMVATDIAARGIDVTRISHVINYDMPDTIDAYTHRIGRTGRAAKTGDAFTLITNEDGDMVRAIERVLGSRIEKRTLQNFDYGKAAPVRNNEFARPPREPQRRRPQPSAEAARSQSTQMPRQTPPRPSQGTQGETRRPTSGTPGETRRSAPSSQGETRRPSQGTQGETRRSAQSPYGNSSSTSRRDRSRSSSEARA